MEETALIKVEELNAVELFTPEGMDNLLTQIKKKIDNHACDASTPAGREDVKSFAYLITRSKTIIDGVGKEHTAKEKARLKLVDVQRKRARDTLETWRDEVRQPLTDWEAEEKAKEDALRLQAEIEIDEGDAHAYDALFEREREVAAKEAEAARLEQERQQKERDKRIAEAAAEKAKRDAEAAIAREREAKENAERERIEAEARAKAEKEAAVKEAERKAKAEAEYKEVQRIEAEQADREKQERRAANKRHRAKIEREAVESLELLDMRHDAAVALVEEIARGNVANITINY